MKHHLTIICALALGLASCQQDSLEGSGATATQDAGEVARILPGATPGKLYVRLDDATTRAMATRSGAEHDLDAQLAAATTGRVSRIHPLFPIDPRFEKRMRRAGLDRWYVVEFDQQADLQQMATALSRTDAVTRVEPVYTPMQPKVEPRYADADAAKPRTRATANPLGFDDPELPRQWNLYNDGTVEESVAGADVNLAAAHQYTTGKPNVIVAVTDFGVVTEHPDLKGSMWTNEAELNGKPGVDDDGNGFVDDIHGYNFVMEDGQTVPGGHGTHVAGIIAARNNNGEGVSSIAGGDGSPDSGVRLMTLQFFRNDALETGGYNPDVPATFVYAANNGAVISQNSWGDDYPGNGYMTDALKAGIDYFIEYAGCDADGNQRADSPMKGGVVVFAAGNDGDRLTPGAGYVQYPAYYEPVVAVTAMGPDWKRAFYSNFGTWADIPSPSPWRATPRA